MRLLVCGGRTFDEWRKLADTLDALEKPDVLIQGGASGADRLAIKWAETRGVPIITFPANWKRGKAGGPERNAFMLKEGKPDLVIAFPGGRGTYDMVCRARGAYVEVREIP